MTFCNPIEETLFEPLPASLWTDYYQDRQTEDDDATHVSVARLLPLPRRRRRLSQKDGMILPSACHFRSLSPQASEDLEEDGSGGSFDDEYSLHGSSSSGMGIGRTGSSTEVKPLFHNNGCLFAYAALEEDGAAVARSSAAVAAHTRTARRSRTGRKGLSPLARSRTKTISRSSPQLIAVDGIHGQVFR